MESRTRPNAAMVPFPTLAGSQAGRVELDNSASFAMLEFDTGSPFSRIFSTSTRSSRRIMSRPPRIIKGDQLPPVGPEKFNIIDTNRELETRIIAGRTEVEGYQKKAESDAKALHTKARQEGFDVGYKEGFAKATQEVNNRYQQELTQEVQQRWESLAGALRQVVGELTKSREIWLGDWEKYGVELACGIAERVVREKLDEPNEVAKRTLAEVLAMVGRCPYVTVYLNPKDLETFDMTRDGFESISRAIGEVKVLADPALTPGGCRLATEYGAIDASVEMQLQRIADELSGKNEQVEAPSSSNS